MQPLKLSLLYKAAKEGSLLMGHMPLMIQLEFDVNQPKCDLQLSRNKENGLWIVCYISSERSFQSVISNLLAKISGLEARINSLCWA